MLSHPRDRVLAILAHQRVLVNGRLGVILVWLEETGDDERFGDEPASDAVPLW